MLSIPSAELKVLPFLPGVPAEPPDVELTFPYSKESFRIRSPRPGLDSLNISILLFELLEVKRADRGHVRGIQDLARCFELQMLTE